MSNRINNKLIIINKDKSHVNVGMVFIKENKVHRKDDRMRERRRRRGTRMMMEMIIGGRRRRETRKKGHMGLKFVEACFIIKNVFF